jgi:hypothetical protein
MPIAASLRRKSSFSAGLLKAIWMLATLLATASTIQAQAPPTAQKIGDLSAFVLYTRLTPDYGPTTNNGVTLGLDYTRYTRWWVKPSIEVRGKIANGSTVDERSFGGGIRAVKPIRIFRPYADFLISAGSINFHQIDPYILPNGQPYTSDSTVTYSFGGGLDIDLSRNFSMRGDYQSERWHLDKNPATPLDLTPSGWSLGMVYRIPFRSFSQ